MSVDDRGELAVQVGPSDAGEPVSSDEYAVGPAPVEGVGGVQSQDDAVPQVAAHARGRLDAVVGGDTGQDETTQVVSAQPAIEIWGPVEAGVDGLADQQVRLPRHQLLEGVARLARSKRRPGLEGVVAHEDDGPVTRPPLGQQRGDVVLTGRVVARTPVRGVVEALLHVDDEQRQAVRVEQIQLGQVHAVSVPHRPSSLCGAQMTLVPKSHTCIFDAVTIGLRIAEARARAGKTQADLAREAALDRSALAKIENGVRRVTALELARIADAIGARIEWFLTEAPPSLVSHRNAQDSGTLTPAIDQAVEAAARDAEFVQAHDSSWLLPQSPDFERPGNHDESEHLAARVRGLLDLDDRPAHDLIEFAASLGLTTFSLDLGPGKADGAMILLREGGVAVVNGALFTGRRRLTLAHELGHYLCAMSTPWTGGSARQTTL